MMVNTPDTDPTVRTSAEQRHATAHTRQTARANRTIARRNARRAKYAAQPFNAQALLADLHAEGITQ